LPRSRHPPHYLQLGFKATPANLLTVPVYVFACIVTISAGFYADRKGRRGIQNMCGLPRPLHAPSRVC
jgi:hypothetical protein